MVHVQFWLGRLPRAQCFLPKHNLRGNFPLSEGHLGYSQCELVIHGVAMSIILHNRAHNNI